MNQVPEMDATPIPAVARPGAAARVLKEGAARKRDKAPSGGIAEWLICGVVNTSPRLD